MFEYFYNEILRSTIIAFGSLFNDIQVKHKNDEDDVWSVIKVPLAYGPTQKFLARLEQTPNLNTPVQMTLPRMSFEFTDLVYDPERKVTKTQKFVATDSNGSQTKRAYMPVPYNMTFELSAMTKLNDDMLQITEQILPYFAPGYTIPIKVLGAIKEIMNVPVVLEGITMEDDYEGNFDTRRALVYTFRFTAKVNLYGPVKDVSSSIIDKVNVGYISGTRNTVTGSSQTYERDVTYSVTPRALKDYDGVVVTNLAADITDETEVITVVDGNSISDGTDIYIGEELMFVRNITGNKITVTRGKDQTLKQTHVSGAPVYGITSNDATFIEVGDNFGFDGGFI